MLKPKKKIKLSSKELKKDELLTFVEQVSAWYYENQRNVTTVAIAVVIVVAATVFYFYNANSENERASGELGKVYSLYDQQQFEQAIEGVAERNIPGLKTIADKYSGTDAGEIAELYLANAYFALGKFDEAHKHYDDCSVSDSRLQAAVQAGLASCEELKKNYKEAGEHFQKAAALSGTSPISAEYLFNAAYNYSRAGEKESAAEFFKRLKKEFPQSQQARDIDRYLTQLAG